MKNSLRLLIAVLVIVSVAFLGCQNKKEIKIGFITEITGVEAYIGQTSIPSLQDYIDEINKAGGFNGCTLKLVSYDTRSEATDAIGYALVYSIYNFTNYAFDGFLAFGGQFCRFPVEKF